MSFSALSARRKLAGRFGCLILVLVLAALVDGMVAGGLKDPSRTDLLPGQSVSLSDRLPPGAETLADIRLRTSGTAVSVRLVETYSGFWLGGVLWRAEATLSPDARPGDTTVSVLYANGTVPAPPLVFTLRAHPDERALMAASTSLITRLTGLAPYLMAVCLLPLAALSMVASMLLSRRIAAALRQEGMAEVYRAMAGPEGQQVFFCPGPGHGLAPGDVVEVLDERGEARLGAALVAELIRGDVRAVMQDGAHVRPGSLARPAPKA